MATATAIPEQTRFTTEKHPFLLFYDGECAFCNRWVAKVKDADHERRMRYGVKQGRTFQEVVKAHPELANVESVVVVKRRADGGEDFLVRSAAIREVIKGLPQFRFFEIVLQICPTFLSDIGYRIFSKLRAPLFGKWHHCRVPIEADRELYVE
jgi:predicted DCC family thiol-disulfide oxidoreductase YuxK